MARRRVVLLLLAALFAGESAAVERITVKGLFKDRALLEIDGRRALLRAGQTSREGVTLVSADSRAAVVELAGKRQRLELGTAIGSSFEPPREKVYRIVPTARGMYFTTGSVNGFPTRFVVDTGATLVSMSAGEARRLGIDFRLVGTPARSTTASGVARVWLVRLERVKVGEIELRDVEAAVHHGDFPPVTLLGMSFLRRLEMSRSDGALILRRRY